MSTRSSPTPRRRSPPPRRRDDDEEALLSKRGGRVLDSRSLVKEDLMEDSSTTTEDLRTSGARCFRTRMELKVSGLAQPTVAGIRGVLNSLRARRGGTNDVLWLNLREEPLVFVNGRGVVLRDKTEPFSQVTSFDGIESDRLETLEWRLKEDLVDEQIPTGNVLLHCEPKPKTLKWKLEAAPPSEISTHKEIFNALRFEGYRVRYVRIPCSSYKPPEPRFFDRLLSSILQGQDFVVAHCRTGGTRTTVGMVTACLVQTWRGKISSVASEHETSDDSKVKAQNAMEAETTDEISRQLLAGWNSAVLSLIRLLPATGRKSKLKVDAFVDRCGDLVNLRTYVYRYRLKASHARGAKTRAYYIDRAVAALSSYILLITFEAYLDDRIAVALNQKGSPPTPAAIKKMHSSKRFDTDDGLDVLYTSEVDESTVFLKTFEEWLLERPELGNLFSHIEENKIEALEAVDYSQLSHYVPEGPDAERIREVVTRRRGAMLNTDTILKADLLGTADMASTGRRATISIEGAPCFRNVRSTRVFGVGTATIEGIRGVVRFLRTAFNAKRVVWVNLREEPVVYIRDRPFVLRSISRPFQNTRGFCDIESGRLEEAETNLVNDVKKEASSTGTGSVLVHEENEELALQHHWEGPVDFESEDEIQSPKDVFELLLNEEQLENGYIRVPVTAEEVPDSMDVSGILRAAAESSSADCCVVFACQMGRARSTFGTVLACLALDDLESERGREHDRGLVVRGEDYAPILALTRVLKHGEAAKIWLDFWIDECSAVENLREDVENRREAALGSDSSAFHEDALDRARVALKRYFVLVAAAGYIYEQKTAGMEFNEFEMFWSERPEIHSTLYALCDKEDALEPATTGMVLDAPPELDDQRAPSLAASRVVQPSKVGKREAGFVSSREGRVLVRGSILKSDHFPGCDRLPNEVRSVKVDGSPNFRSLFREVDVPFNETLKKLRVYGTAIPTEKGAKVVLELLPKNEKVLWIFMREEPILYVNGSPYCLRKLDRPFKNLAHTGISRERVEAMEIRMKGDVLSELIESPIKDVLGKTLLHEEDENGIVPRWTNVFDVCTPKEMFSRLSSRLVYARVPVTDEQAPKVLDFDEISKAISSVPITTHVVLNCQMGRGRTTTGTVVACAFRLWQNDSLDEFPNIIDKSSRLFRSRVRNGLNGDLSSEERSALNGEFRAVVDLARILSKGASAKHIADSLIDYCDDMQNLREAIWDVKLRADSNSLSPVARSDELGRVAQYVRRYYQLVGFTAYLLSKRATAGQLAKATDTFAHWLRKRAEVRHLMHAMNANVV